jgi:hypothetical protein
MDQPRQSVLPLESSFEARVSYSVVVVRSRKIQNGGSDG